MLLVDFWIIIKVYVSSSKSVLFFYECVVNINSLNSVHIKLWKHFMNFLIMRITYISFMHLFFILYIQIIITRRFCTQWHKQTNTLNNITLLTKKVNVKYKKKERQKHAERFRFTALSKHTKIKELSEHFICSNFSIIFQMIKFSFPPSWPVGVIKLWHQQSHFYNSISTCMEWKENTVHVYYFVTLLWII